MPIIIVIGLLIVGYLIIYLSSLKKPIAEAIITATNEGVDVRIIYDKNNKKSLYAMALLYFIKIKWIILTEPNWLNDLFRDGLNEILNSWPIIPDLNVVPVDKDKPLIFNIKIYEREGKWIIINTIPSKVYAVDPLASCFILLKEILKELNDDEKNKLKDLFLKIKNELLNLNDASFSVVRKWEIKISELLRP